jgi:hypothetical protein
MFHRRSSLRRSSPCPRARSGWARASPSARPKGLVDRAFDLYPRRCGDGADRAQVVAVQIGRLGRGPAVHQLHVGMRIGDHLLARKLPVPVLHRPEIHRRRGAGRDRRAILRDRQVVDLLRPPAIRAISIAGLLGRESLRRPPVPAVWVAQGRAVAHFPKVARSRRRFLPPGRCPYPRITLRKVSNSASLPAIRAPSSGSCPSRRPETRPPASLTSRSPAAMSQGCSSRSQ